MRIGLVLPMEAPAGDPERSALAMLMLAERAEAIGLDSVWVCDHFFSSVPGERREGIHEAWTILSAIAARTRRVELGTLVACVSYRPPAMLAKMASTADAMSGGRVTLGIGAGLLPLERPIPLLVAGEGPRMLRLTARHADAWNTGWYGMPDADLRRQLDAMDAALDAEGRDRSTLRRTIGVSVEEPDEEGPSVPLDDLPRAADAYAALGVDDVLLGGGWATERALDRLADVLDLRPRRGR